MRTPPTMVNRWGTAIGASVLLLAWTGAVESGEQVGPYAETKLLADDGDALDQLGYTVAISGDTAVIGASSDDELGVALLSGAAYVFERDPRASTVWTQSAKLVADDSALDDNFGFSVAISGDTVVVGARSDDDLGFDSGSAYVFERDPLDPTVWKQTVKLLAADGAVGDHFGRSVAISAGTALIGAFNDDELGLNSGSAYLFKRDPLNPALWKQIEKFTASDGAEEDSFGLSVAISGATSVIGAYQDDDLDYNSGSAFVYSPESLLRLRIEGACPGTVTIQVSGATPSGRVPLLASASLGSFTLPGGPCAGTHRGLADPRLLGVFTADGGGEVSRTVQAPLAACGANLQALDVGSCGTTNVEQIP